MINLLNKNLSYIIGTPNLENQSNSTNAKYTSITNSKGYSEVDLVSIYNNINSISFLSFSEDNDNNRLRMDALYLINELHLKSIIVKYNGDDYPIRIFENGSEKLLSISIYGSDTDKLTYISEGVSFYFEERTRYFFPNKKEEIRNGIKLEMLINESWVTREVTNIDNEWDDVYKLFTKYEKVRIAID